jgi:UDP-N-acetylmuramoylalanine--D-glutamate ligase
VSQPQVNILPGKKYAPTQLGRVLILGLGKSGKAAYEYCSALLGERIEHLSIAAGQKSEDALAFVERIDTSKIDLCFDVYDFEERFDLCIASPGISQFSDFYQNAQAASTEIISEVEFAWRESAESARWIAITGTNGKTTTTALLAHILTTSGFSAAAVGNIGSTCLEEVSKGSTDVYVAEVSSYQLASTRMFAPSVAILLNITPDHLAWHTSHGNYVEAKHKVFQNLSQTQDVYAIVDAVGQECRALVKSMKALSRSERGYSYIPLGTAAGIGGDMRKACQSENAAFLDNNKLCVALNQDEYYVAGTDELRIRGEHNAANALAATAAALVVGADSDAIRSALLSFEALEHRMEECGSLFGMKFFNDSKATNIDATLKALSAFEEEKPLVLLGGHDKGTDLSVLVEEAEKRAQAVICYGAAGKRIYDAFDTSSVSRFLESNLEAAFERALSVGKPGDVVLLSPACASFDEFDSFEHRGRVFKELIRRRSSRQGG